MPSHVEINAILTYLKHQPLISAIDLTFADQTVQRSVYKLRCRLIPGQYQLYIRLIQTPTEVVYSYQLFTEHPIVRWDNAPHFPNIPSFPHHFHDQTDTVQSSPLQGDIFVDLHVVLTFVQAVIHQREYTE